MAGIRDYLPFFHLKTQPFRLSPDPEFFFPAHPHIAALHCLKFAIERGEGFMVLTGSAGTGKTLLLRLLLKELHEEKQPAVIVTPAVSPEGLVRLLLDELRQPVEEASVEFSILLKRFQNALIELAASGRELLVIIDESQDVPVATLEQLRLLSNIELDDRKIIQILLLGQTELDAVLADPRLGQLTQRIVVNETLPPLSREETGDYILFRLARAGRADLEITERAVSTLYEYTGGIPRMINRIMDRALLMAAAQGVQKVRRQDVVEAGKTLPRPADLSGLSYGKASSPAWTVMKSSLLRKIVGYALPAAAMVLAGIITVWLGTQKTNHCMPEPPASTVRQAEGTSLPVPHAAVALAEAAISPSLSAGSIAAHATTPRQVIVVVNRALIRKGPGSKFDFVSAVSSGDLLTSRGENGKWTMVDIWNAAGKKGTGWIRNDLIRAISSIAGREK